MENIFNNINIKYNIVNNIDINQINKNINLDINKINILIYNINKFEILYENNDLYILLKISIIDNSRYIIYNNNIYIDKLNKYEIISKYLDFYHIQEKTCCYNIKNDFISLYGYYLNLVYSSNTNYFHFIFETLPYLYIFLKNNNILYDNNYKFKILINNDFNIIASLFNINIIYTEKNNYNIEKLIIPKNINTNYTFNWNKNNIFKNENIMNYDYSILLELRNFIFNKFNIKPFRKKKSYLKRNNKFRILINSNYIEKIIDDFNFNNIIPENMSFEKQVKYFSEINTLICQGGAGMTNILFMPENSNVIVIAADSEFVDCNFFNKLFIELNINFHIIKAVPIYLNDNIYENNFEYINKIGLEKHPYNSNIYLNNENIKYLIKLLKKYTHRINYNFIYSEEINNDIFDKYNFYLKDEINNNITDNVDFDKNYYKSYIFMVKNNIKNNIKLINYYNNIYIVKNNKNTIDINTIERYFKINKKLLLNKDNIHINKESSNVLLNSNKINDITNYNYDHTEIDFTNKDNLKPLINTFENYINKNSNKNSNLNSLIIEEAVFFNSFSNCHYILPHLFYDFIQHINMYYNFLLTNNNCNIILEIIPFNNFSINKFDLNNTKIENYININNIDKLINFIRDIGINNKIIIISPISKYQNFDNDSLFIKKLYYTTFIEYDNINWIPLLSRLYKNNYNNYFCDTIKSIIKKIYNNEENIHYLHHKKKFFILENPSKIILNNNYYNSDNIIKICEEYCNINNLKFVLWDKCIIERETILEQYNIINNSEIIIFSSNFFNMFNFSIDNGKILILNNKIDYERQYEELYNLSFYKFNNLFKNKYIDKIVIHYYDNNNLYNIINYFLYN